MLRVSRPSFRLLGLPVVLALVVGVLGVVAAPAADAVTAAPSATFIKCNDKGPASAVYAVVGGAPLHVKSWQNYGYNISGGPSAPTANAQSCKSMPVVPKDGTYVRGVTTKKNSSGTVVDWTWTGPTYEIVGGTPVTVHAWANIGLSGAPSGSPKAVDNTVLTALVAPGAACPSSYAGCLYSRPRSGATFAGFSTATKKAATYYKVDSAGHPIPQAAAVSGPVVDQTSINACERMDCDPVGDVETSSTSYGVLHLEGYAMDFPQATAASVQLQVDQGSTYTVAANQPGAYAPAGAAGNHNFSVNLALAAGTHEVCATVIGSTPGASTQALGCSYPTVIGAKPGKVKKVKLKALGHGKVKVKWKRVKANGNPISSYMLKCGGSHRKQLSGAKVKHILKHQSRGRRLSCKVRAVSGGSSGGYGKWSKKSKTITVR